MGLACTPAMRRIAAIRSRLGYCLGAWNNTAYLMRQKDTNDRPIASIRAVAVSGTCSVISESSERYLTGHVILGFIPSCDMRYKSPSGKPI